ncbi:MAG: flagellar type III secretion system pore protein FliP [Paracoccaceae bacterium]
MVKVTAVRHLLPLALLALTAATLPALAQDQPGAGDLLDLAGRGLQAAGEAPTLSGQSMTLIALVTVLSLAPGIAVMVTCFPFIVTVLAILRQAIGLQQSPPNMLIVSLALFLTWFIMEPVFTEAWLQAGKPLSEGQMDIAAAFEAGIRPFRAFMAARLDPDTLASLAGLRPETAGLTDPATAPLSLLVPSFMLSELARAFEIGFLLYLPFLIIDLVVSAILMSMGMMMVPPAIVSLPFKLAFFVVADGWSLVSGALVRSYF